ARWTYSAAPWSCSPRKLQLVPQLRARVLLMIGACLASLANAFLEFLPCRRACKGIAARMAADVFKGQDRSHDLLRAHNGTGVVRKIDVESGVHLGIGIVRCRVFDDRNLIAKLGCKADGRFNAGMRYQADD